MIQYDDALSSFYCKYYRYNDMCGYPFMKGIINDNETQKCCESDCPIKIEEEKK